MSTENKLETLTFTLWIKFILTTVKKKIIKKLNHNIQTTQTKPILYDLDVKSYLQAPHIHFVVETTDKAGNNFAFLCKK